MAENPSQTANVRPLLLLMFAGGLRHGNSRIQRRLDAIREGRRFRDHRSFRILPIKTR
jgi:hypothetical protein